MLPLHWQLSLPLDAIIFDCDGTLSCIEGIDELAKNNGVGDAVTQLTHIAMSQTGITPKIYHERLQLVQPTLRDIETLGQRYIATLTPDTLDVIHIFQKMGKAIYIISAGVYPAVALLADFLNIPRAHVFAIDIAFDAHGNYLGFDRHSPLIRPIGKCSVVEAIKQKHPRLGYTGDGMNDMPVRPLVTRLVGFGGAYYRKNIAAMCEFYITANSMAPLLPLMLTEKEAHHLTQTEKVLYEKGLKYS